MIEVASHFKCGLFSWKDVRVMSQSNLGFESCTAWDDNVIHKYVQHQVDPPWETKWSSNISCRGWCHFISGFDIHIEPNKWPSHWAWRWFEFVNLRSACSSLLLEITIGIFNCWSRKRHYKDYERCKKRHSTKGKKMIGLHITYIHLLTLER